MKQADFYIFFSDVIAEMGDIKRLTDTTHTKREEEGRKEGKRNAIG